MEGYFSIFLRNQTLLPRRGFSPNYTFRILTSQMKNLKNAKKP